ncbi:MAG: hypothetical protein AAB649_00700 [Patescibacteria group bacterium]
MKTFLVESMQKNPRWSRPIKHIKANDADEAKCQFAYLLDCTPVPVLQAHELKSNEFGEVCGKEDCSSCFEYLHAYTKYYCHTPNCDTQGILLSLYDLNESQGVINCEYCDKPLHKSKSE